MTNDLVKHDYNEASIETQQFRFFLFLFLFQSSSTLGGPTLQNTEAPLFRISSYVFLHLAIDLYSVSYPLINWYTCFPEFCELL